MTQTVQDVMTASPQTLDVKATVQEAAKLMADHDIGNVIVTDGDTLCGIVTDRDIAVRVVAEGKDPSTTAVGDFCTRDIVTVGPTDSVDDAIRLMKDNAIRRLPVVDGKAVVGIVSLGDLAGERDLDAALDQISEAPANN